MYGAVCNIIAGPSKPPQSPIDTPQTGWSVGDGGIMLLGMVISFAHA